MNYHRAFSVEGIWKCCTKSFSWTHWRRTRIT